MNVIIFSNVLEIFPFSLLISSRLEITRHLVFNFICFCSGKLFSIIPVLQEHLFINGNNIDGIPKMKGEFTCPLCRAKTDVNVIDKATMDYNDWKFTLTDMIAF